MDIKLGRFLHKSIHTKNILKIGDDVQAQFLVGILCVYALYVCRHLDV